MLDGRLVLAGDSAGGNLVVCTCLALDAATRKHILGQVLIYPQPIITAPGLALRGKSPGQLLTAAIVTWFWDTYLAGLPRMHPRPNARFPRRSPDTGTATHPAGHRRKRPLRGGKAYAGQLGEAGVQVRFHHFDNAARFCLRRRSQQPFPVVRQLTSWLSGLDKPIEERQL